MLGYFAPLEGVTDSLYRQVHHRFFPGVDKYFTPFLSPTQHHVFTPRELREILPEQNKGIPVVPQLLTRNADDFLWCARELKAMGYDEVNLNLGCPSGTVTAKRKGSGLLQDLGELEGFLDQIFSDADLSISVKTRLGYAGPEEFPALLDLFNRYPIRELTVHPRIRTDFYRHPVRMEGFTLAAERAKAPLCYNGDLVSRADLADVSRRFPNVDRVMIGRGLVANPALLSPAPADKDTLRAFHDALYEGYTQRFGSRRNAMLRLKEIWFYLSCLFEDSERTLRKLRKTTDTGNYETIVDGLFRDHPLHREAEPRWLSPKT